MRHKKNITKLLVVILAILIVVLGSTLLREKTPSPNAPYNDRAFNLTPEKVKNITVRNKDNNIVLERSKDGWTVNSKKARKNRVNDLLTTLLPKENPKIINNDPTKKQEYGLNREKRIEITLNGKPKFFFGKPTDGGVFVEIEGSDNTYLLPNSEASSDADIMLDFASLVDMFIFTAKPEMLSVITIRGDGNESKITNKDEKWINEKNDQEILSDKISPFIASILYTKAHSFFSETSNATYSPKPNLSLKIIYDGKQEILEYYKGSTDYMVKRKSDNERFILDETDIAPLLSMQKEFI